MRVGALDSVAGSLRILSLSGNTNLTGPLSEALLPLKKVRSLCLADVPLNCCGMEPFRDNGAIDDGCSGPAICSSPATVQGMKLAATTGLLCGTPPAPKKSTLSRGELAGIAGAGGVVVLVLLVLLLRRINSRRDRAAMDTHINSKSSERTSLLTTQSNVVFEEA